MSGQQDRVWLYNKLSDEMDELLRSGDARVRSFRVLPFIVVSTLHPLASSALPGVTANYIPSIEELQVAAAIDTVLWEVRALSKTTAPNGNRWAAGVDTAPYVDYDQAAKAHVFIEGVSADVALGYPAVLNLSLQLWPGDAPSETSMFSVAIRIAATQMPVIVAAGNWRKRGDFDTLNPLAKLPSVISVGAMADEKGSALADTSSIGAPGGTGPTVTAYGENPHVKGQIETSYAAPRVAVEVIFITAFLLQLRAMSAVIRTRTPLPAPLLIHSSVDTGFDGFEPRPDLPLPMLPYGVGIDSDNCAAALRILATEQFDCSFMPTPELVIALVLRSATPTTGPPNEVGLGFVHTENTLRMLTAMTWRDITEVFGGHVNAADELDRMKVASADELSHLLTFAHESRLKYAVDFRTGEVHATMRPNVA